MSIAAYIGGGAPGRLIVSGGPLKPPLLQTSEATVMGFYDRHGDLHTVVYRAFTDDMWAMVTKQDEDWRATLMRLGIEDQQTIVIPTLTERRDLQLQEG